MEVLNIVFGEPGCFNQVFGELSLVFMCKGKGEFWFRTLKVIPWDFLAFNDSENFAFVDAINP